MIPLPLHKLLAITLASLFFAFQTELDHEEYQRQHRPLSSIPAIAAPSLTWETFDKQNAQKAFVLTVERGSGFVLISRCETRVFLSPRVSIHPVRDKSPPPAAHDTPLA